MRVALADALLPSSAACVEAQAMSGLQLRCLEARMMGHEEVLQPVHLFGRLVFAPLHAVVEDRDVGWTVELLART